MSDEFAKGYKYGNYVTKNISIPFVRDMERFSINNFHQKIPFTGDPRLTAGYDKGVEDMTLALKNQPRQGEKMTVQELMQKLAPQPQGAVGNVTDNEMSMFLGSPVGGALAGIAGGVSNPMPRINEMRNNLATAGSAGNASNREVDMINRLNEIKKIGQERILTDGEKQEAMFIQKILPPVEVIPPDIDDLKLSPEALRELLNVIENPNFRGFPMNGGR